ncbi:MAG: hypothetical protein HY264_04810 [Chloroflexi bacterium]|nr:hypothetical protein [Chloroflexota bacterium]
MIPSSSRAAHPRAWRTAIAAGLVVVLATALAACGSSSASFNPSGTCGADGKAPGAYPNLERRLPTRFEGTSPTSIDSGRHCSESALGSLITHGAAGIEFAGATWDLGSGAGVSSALFSLPDRQLPVAWIAEFYEIGARTAKRTGNITTSRPTFDGAGPAYRLDTLNDLSLQSVVTWQDGDLVRVVLVATKVDPGATRAAHDDLVSKAVAATVAVMGGP